MARIFIFTTSLFDPAKEPPNLIDPIAGYALLEWLGKELTALGFEVTQPPSAEDRGRFIDASKGNDSYMIGSYYQSAFEKGETDWQIQVHKHRS